MFFHKKEPAAGAGAISWLLVGLGNPGKKYENTRHNAGFLAVDAIAGNTSASIKKLKFKSVTGEASIGGTRVLLMKPDTFMNNSGEAVVAAMNFYKIPIEHVLVFVDDISLEPGKLRIRRKGSDGGHNGLKSILYLTGSDQFPRVRLGVGAKPHPDYDLAAWVLSSFKPDEQKSLLEACGKCTDIAGMILEGSIDAAMSKFNS